MKKSEILKILGDSVKSYRVNKGHYYAWLEVRVESILYRDIKKILENLIQIEPIDEYTILLVFDIDTTID